MEENNNSKRGALIFIVFMGILLLGIIIFVISHKEQFYKDDYNDTATKITSAPTQAVKNTESKKDDKNTEPAKVTDTEPAPVTDANVNVDVNTEPTDAPTETLTPAPVQDNTGNDRTEKLKDLGYEAGYISKGITFEREDDKSFNLLTACANSDDPITSVDLISPSGTRYSINTADFISFSWVYQGNTISYMVNEGEAGTWTLEVYENGADELWYKPVELPFHIVSASFSDDGLSMDYEIENFSGQILWMEVYAYHYNEPGTSPWRNCYMTSFSILNEDGTNFDMSEHVVRKGVSLNYDEPLVEGLDYEYMIRINGLNDGINDVIHTFYVK